MNRLILLIGFLNFHLGIDFGFRSLTLSTDQLSLQKLGYVEEDGEDEGRDDVGGQVERGGIGHLGRDETSRRSTSRLNLILKET